MSAEADAQGADSDAERFRAAGDVEAPRAWGEERNRAVAGGRSGGGNRRDPAAAAATAEMDDKQRAAGGAQLML